MASANIPLSEEQFKCSICLNVFNEPVSTPCGHNYCKGCITGYWALKDFSHCPLCSKKFPLTPELQVNTEFRDMLDLFKRARASDDDSSPPALPGDVPCDLCQGGKRKALKSCLVCLVSYCNTHLQSYHTIQAFKWHKLINPVATLQDRMCKRHNKVIEFFCRKDQSCVCTECLRDDHAMHEAVPLHDELNDRKTELQCRKRAVDRTMSRKRIMSQRIKKSVKEGRQEVETTKAEIIRAFAALVLSIKTRKVMLIELLEEKQQVAEEKAEAVLRDLQLEIIKNQQTSSELDKFSKTEDDFKLLQGLPSISYPSNSKHCFISIIQPFLHVETLRSAVAKTEETLAKHMEEIISEVNLADKGEVIEELMDAETQNVSDNELGKVQQQHAVKVTLDPNTAHPSLIVSEDRKQVRDGGTKRTVLDNPQRLDTLTHFVLGNEGYSSGKFYYEVELKGETGWAVGVAREFESKKGVDLCLSPDNGCWTLGSYFGRCQANANPAVTLLLPQTPQKVGVFVDYEGGLVSFYDVDTRALIYSFTQCVFRAGVQFRSYFWMNPLYPKNTRIYPIFRPSSEEGGNSAPLQITTVRCTKGK
ncbi:E3 ubiquitin-protein ligase TRIM7-like [Scophthalmus maximus]|uniref:E3 ubiquitin-protein ligase TRIM39-like n=1 Tax=Scophthalmus maximus TaxID=52904 RepID=A0A8D2ZV01_SCOMX|nr:E3 ubiquitin-protein ligase TRIM7-like [Scophthalmus maximus]